MTSILCCLRLLPGRGAGHPGAGPRGVGHQDLAQGREGAEEVPGQLGQILNHQLQSPEVRRKVLIVNTRTLSVTADCVKAELSTTIHDPKVN